jgi:hypothetical protein
MSAERGVPGRVYLVGTSVYFIHAAMRIPTVLRPRLCVLRRTKNSHGLTVKGLVPIRPVAYPA